MSSATQRRPAHHPPATPGSADIDLLRIDDQLTADERLVRDTVRNFAADRIQPHIADWFEEGTLPRDLMPELGKLGAARHAPRRATAAPGWARSPTAWPAGSSRRADSGPAQHWSRCRAHWPCSRSGSTAPRSRRPSGCPGWRRARRSAASASPSPITAPTRPACGPRARRDGSDWVLSGTKMWITNGSIADIAVVWARTEEGIRGLPRAPRRAPASPRSDIHKKLSLRASITSELHFDDVRLPADAVLPGVTGLKGPLSCLTEARFGIIWGATGAARACFESAVEYATDTRAVRPADRRLPAHPVQARVDGFRAGPRATAGAAPRPAEGSRAAAPRARSAWAR